MVSQKVFVERCQYFK